jgi:MATE family multidrug resistance protein
MLSRSLGSSWRDSAPIARASLARDLEEEEEEEDTSGVASSDDEDDGGLLSSSAPARERQYSLYQSYRRNSFVAAGNRARMPVEFGSTAGGRSRELGHAVSREERRQLLEEERSLLRDNNLIPPKHARGPEGETELVYLSYSWR